MEHRKDIQAEIAKFEVIPDGVAILEQALLREGIEKLTRDNIEELREILTGTLSFIPKGKMERLVSEKMAREVPYVGKKDAFREVAHQTYRLIEGGMRQDGWYPLPDNFFGHR